MTVMKHSLQFCLASLSLWLLLAATSCQPGPTAPANRAAPAREHVTGVRGGSITYRVTTPPKTFDYLMGTDEPSLDVSFYLIGGRLVEFDQDTLRYTPALAEDWKLGDDGRTLALTLRDGLQFSDGHPLTADDVLFTFRAIYDQRTNSPIFRDAMMIGGRPIDVSSVDARHLKLVFPEPVAAPEDYLSNVVVLPRHVLEPELNKGTLREAYGITSDPKGIVTSGAFAVEAVAPGERVTLRRNPNYWKKDQSGASLPYLDNIVIAVVADSNNAMTRLGQGDLDIIDRIRPTDYAALRSSAGPVRAFDLGPGLTTDYIIPNLNEAGQSGKPGPDPVKSAWFTDVRFRRALSYAIDRDSICSSTLQGLATPLYSFVSPGNHLWDAPDLPHPTYDLNRAKALLAEAGFNMRGTDAAPELYDAKGNRVEFTLLVPVESEPRKAEAAVIQQDLARLGMRVQVAPMDTGEMTRRLSESFDFDTILFGSTATEFDPSSYASLLLSNSAGHQWHPKEPRPATDWEARIDQLFTDQARERDAERRRAEFREVQSIFIEQQPIIPIVSRHIATAANARVGNYRPGVALPYSLWNADELFIHK